MWTAVCGIGMCAYGIWLIVSVNPVGFGPEAGASWFFVHGRAKRIVGIAIVLGGLLVLRTAFRGSPLFG
jgi:hypothetical protein